MELRRLRHLMALAHEQHFGRAAERVNLSQSAFSRSIQALEDEAGTPLFERASNEVIPTAAGTFLIGRAQRLLADAHAMALELKQFKAAQRGRIAFGVGPFAGATLVPQLVCELRRRSPEVSMRVEISNWQVLLERLITEDLEFFVAEVRELPGDPRLLITALGRQRGGFYVRREHPLLERACLVKDVLEAGLLSVSLPGDVKRFLASKAEANADMATLLALECDDFSLLKTVAMATDSVLAATHMALQVELDQGLLVELTPKDLPEGHSELGLVQLRNREVSPLAAELIRGIEASLGRYGKAPRRRKR
jgi:DNA-binding transcriptional LysR family regulator